MPLPLETPRLILRPFEMEDIEAFSDYRSDPEVARYQGWNAPFTRAQAARFIEEMRAIHPGIPGRWYQVALGLKPGGELVGDCAFRLLDETPHQAEFGITLARLCQGRGLATEALTRLIDYLFDEFDLHRIRAICDVENTASAHLLERLGMRREAHFIDHVWFKGHWSSEYWYAVLKDEWLARRGG